MFFLLQEGMIKVSKGILEPKRRALTVTEMLQEVQKIKKKLRFLVEEVIMLSFNMHMLELPYLYCSTEIVCGWEAFRTKSAGLS